MVEPERPQMTIWRMRIACRITNATGTHSEYVKLIACRLREWIRERASMIRCTYTACLVCFKTYAWCYACLCVVLTCFCYGRGSGSYRLVWRLIIKTLKLLETYDTGTPQVL